MSLIHAAVDARVLKQVSSYYVKPSNLLGSQFCADLESKTSRALHLPRNAVTAMGKITNAPTEFQIMRSPSCGLPQMAHKSLDDYMGMGQNLFFFVFGYHLLKGLLIGF